MAFYPEWLEKKYSEKDLAAMLLDYVYQRAKSLTSVDVAIAGGGPAGLTAAWLLAEKGWRVLVVEQNLGTGGGLRGGGMLLPGFLVEEGEAAELLRRAGLKLYTVAEGVYAVDPTEFAAKMTAKAIDAGAVVLPGVYVEDLVVDYSEEKPRVRGLVVNWTTVFQAGWHVDPLFLEARAVVDATGHDASLVRLLAKRFPRLGLQVPGMSSLDVWKGEKLVVEMTGKVVEGLYVAGMSVAEVYNTPRMGPLGGGMVASGKRVAELIDTELRKETKT